MALRLVATVAPFVDEVRYRVLEAAMSFRLMNVGLA
jgi:hypothetical protein